LDAGRVCSSEEQAAAALGRGFLVVASSPLRMESGLEDGHGDTAPGAIELENGASHSDGIIPMHKAGRGGAGSTSFVKKAIWHGGSVYDAWLNAVSAQVSLAGPSLLHLPSTPPFLSFLSWPWMLLFASRSVK
jgi:hypothetical protein